jgi:hypothetical protein
MPSDGYRAACAELAAAVPDKEAAASKLDSVNHSTPGLVSIVEEYADSIHRLEAAFRTFDKERARERGKKAKEAID